MLKLFTIIQYIHLITYKEKGPMSDDSQHSLCVAGTRYMQFLHVPDTRMYVHPLSQPRPNKAVHDCTLYNEMI